MSISEITTSWLVLATINLWNKPQVSQTSHTLMTCSLLTLLSCLSRYLLFCNLKTASRKSATVWTSANHLKLNTDKMELLLAVSHHGQVLIRPCSSEVKLSHRVSQVSGYISWHLRHITRNATLTGERNRQVSVSTECQCSHHQRYLQ